MSPIKVTDSYVPSDGHVTSSTSCSSSSEGHSISTTASSSSPVDISHRASSPTRSCSSAPLPGQASSSSSSSEELLLTVPSDVLASPPARSSPLHSLYTDEVHIDKHSERTSSPGANNKLPIEVKSPAGIVPGAASTDMGSVHMEERVLALQTQAEACVQRQNVLHQVLDILRRERKTESGQGEGRGYQGYAPTDSAVRYTNIQQLGFPNIGNSCYMNATLQCLLSLSCFWRPIRAQWSSWMDPYSCQMLRCFADVQQARLTSPSTKRKKQVLGALTACVSARCPVFGEDYEQDAHEFLMLCLLQLKEEGEILRTSFFSYICPVANFEFHLKSVRTCISCGRQSSRVDDFNHLSVNLSPTLTHSLHTYFKPTILELHCECGEGFNASEAVEFFTLPRVLILHVKRFNMLGRKLTDVMDIPVQLDLSALPGVFSLEQESRPAGSQDKTCERQDNPGEKSGPKPGTCTHRHLQTPRCHLPFGWQHGQWSLHQ